LHKNLLQFDTISTVQQKYTSHNWQKIHIVTYAVYVQRNLGTLI